jgi:sugar/nucleoside kinase (ribokinase family)
MLDVLSVGSATIDILASSKQLITNKHLISLELSSKNEIDQSLICSGGGATNSAVSFSRLGLKSACLSLIGEDHLSSYILHDLKKEKVSTSLLFKDTTDNTDFSIILIADNGSRSILTSRGSTRLEEKHLDWNKLPKSKWLYISSLEGNLDLFEKLIGFAKENKTKIALNPGNRELSQRKKLIPLLKLTDFLLLNKTEAEILTGLDFDDKKFWTSLASLSPPIFSVTNGRQGAFISVDRKHYFSPAIKIKPVDETGAGDAFGSAFVAGLIYKKSPLESFFWAIKNSASVVSQIGSKPGLLTLKQIHKS